MKLYLKYLKLHLKSTMQYKTSFILSFISQFFVAFSFYFVVISMFDKFNNIKGFTLYEVLLTTGIIYFGFSFNEFFVRGIDNFDNQIVKGKFDRILLRPRNIFFQAMVEEMDFVKISRILQAIAIIVISLVNLNIQFNIFRIIAFVLMLLSSIAIFLSLNILSASYCFITIQGLEVRHIFTDGGKYVAQYPINIYKKGFALFFTVIIPYAFVNYYPLLYFTGKSNNILYCFSPLIVLIYLFISFKVFNIGVKKYSSTGS